MGPHWFAAPDPAFEWCRGPRYTPAPDAGRQPHSGLHTRATHPGAGYATPDPAHPFLNAGAWRLGAATGLAASTFAARSCHMAGSCRDIQHRVRSYFRQPGCNPARPARLDPALPRVCWQRPGHTIGVACPQILEKALYRRVSCRARIRHTTGLFSGKPYLLGRTTTVRTVRGRVHQQKCCGLSLRACRLCPVGQPGHSPGRGRITVSATAPNRSCFQILDIRFSGLCAFPDRSVPYPDAITGGLAWKPYHIAAMSFSRVAPWRTTPLTKIPFRTPRWR